MVLGVNSAPCVENRLRVRLTIDVHEHRVLLRWIKFRRFHHPRIHDNVVAEIELKELRRLAIEGLCLLVQVYIRFKHADNAMIGHLEQLNDRWRIEPRIGVECPLCIWREPIVMRARLTHWCDALRAFATIQTGAVKVLLSRVLWGSVVVKPTSGFVYFDAFDDVDGLGRERRL